MGELRPGAGATGFRPPLLAGRYVVHLRLGRGATSGVYRVFDLHLHTWRAAKVMHPAAARETELRKRFAREAVIMAQLDHPNVVRVVDIATEVALPYLIMELLEGGSVLRYVQTHGRMHPALAVQVGVDLCRGLGALHAMDGVHRDVKPQNVLFDRQGHARLTDFGIARLGTGAPSATPAFDHVTETGMVMGTPAYMAPEQRVDTSKVDARADVFSAGATLFTLVTGTAAMDLAQMDANDERLAAVPDALRDIVMKACSYKVHQRFADGNQMAAALEQLRLGPPPEGTPPLVGEVANLPRRPSSRLSAVEVQSLTELISAGAIEATYEANPAHPREPERAPVPALEDPPGEDEETEVDPPAPPEPEPEPEPEPTPAVTTLPSAVRMLATAGAVLAVVALLVVGSGGAGAWMAISSGARSVRDTEQSAATRNEQLVDLILARQAVISELGALGADQRRLEAEMLVLDAARSPEEADRFLTSLTDAYRGVTVGSVTPPAAMTRHTMQELTEAWDQSRDARAARQAARTSWTGSFAVAVGLAR